MEDEGYELHDEMTSSLDDLWCPYCGGVTWDNRLKSNLNQKCPHRGIMSPKGGMVTGDMPGTHGSVGHSVTNLKP